MTLLTALRRHLTPPAPPPTPLLAEPAVPVTDPGEAEEFIRAHHAETCAPGTAARVAEVRAEIDATGTYTHTRPELEYAARVAWRNAGRCIGRLYWQSLRLRDRRTVTGAAQIAAECVTHLRQAANRGKIRPVITVFPPDRPGEPGPRILNTQLTQYAGYPQPDGSVTGDPQHAELTAAAQRLGWEGDGGRFDVLPLIITTSGQPPRWFPVPRDAVLEVPLTHPEHPWFRELGLRWYAVPVISDMYLDAGGIRYPAAPFNGWYMDTEIGTRDLGDTSRYDQCPAVAERLGLDTSSERTLHRDTAMVVLNRAVLHSFDEAGVTVADHHTEPRRFLIHLQREELAGRPRIGHWPWIVPPTCPTDVFGHYYDDVTLKPGYFRHPPPALP